MSTIPVLTFGWRLRMARETAGLEVDGLAQTLGVYRRTVHRWERDLGRGPDASQLLQIVEITEVDLAWLLRGRDSNPQPSGYDQSGLEAAA
jgi:transcriptional regulator with XRE-family HTH domain